MEFRILPISEEHIEGFRSVLDSVARERRYLSFLEAPSIEESKTFVRRNIKKGYPLRASPGAAERERWAACRER